MKKAIRFLAVLALMVAWAGGPATAEAATYKLKVMCIGDSITAGYPWTYSSVSYPSQMASRLQSDYPGSQFTVLNYGLGGWRTDSIYNALVSQGWLNDDPNIVLVQGGTNDINQGRSGAAIASSLQAIVNACRSHTNADGSHPNVAVSYIIPTTEVSSTASMAAANGYIAGISGALILSSNWNSFYNASAKIAYTSLMNDWLHPNQVGYGVMAGNYYAAVKAYQGSWPTLCSYAVSPATASGLAPAGDTGSFTVTTNQSGCSWTASSNSSWLTITSGASGSTTGAVNYSAAVNTTRRTRTGVISVAGQTHTVTQVAALGRDFNADAKSDILFYHSTAGAMSQWLMDGLSLVQSAVTAVVPDTGWQIKARGDFDGNGTSDVLWLHEPTGWLSMWFLNGFSITGAYIVGNLGDSTWTIIGTGDFDHNGTDDILWYHPPTTTISIWYMNGATIQRMSNVGYLGDTSWTVVGAGDFNGDGYADILWFHPPTRTASIWLLKDGEILQMANVGQAGTGWALKAGRDFNLDGMDDLLWYNSSTGGVVIWFMNGVTSYLQSPVGTIVGSNWQVADTGDYNGDGYGDILWWNGSSGDVGAWLLSGASILDQGTVGAVPDTNWRVK
ncbi:MAG: FG-GAP repeat protein [Deltaproteobacteria bacterium]|nr:FG-GAP repeat protein [Deltaproteobacteria bacterium]